MRREEDAGARVGKEWADMCEERRRAERGCVRTGGGPREAHTVGRCFGIIFFRKSNCMIAALRARDARAPSFRPFVTAARPRRQTRLEREGTIVNTRWCPVRAWSCSSTDVPTTKGIKIP